MESCRIQESKKKARRSMNCMIISRVIMLSFGREKALEEIENGGKSQPEVQSKSWECHCFCINFD